MLSMRLVFYTGIFIYLCLFGHCLSVARRLSSSRSHIGDWKEESITYGNERIGSETEIKPSLSDVGCPSRCVCERDLKAHLVSVNCMYRKLKAVPDIPTDAIRLLLNNNLLTAIQTDQFCNLAELIELDLSTNKIQTLETDAFRGLSKLATLYLRSNVLKYPSSVPSHIFRPLQRLSTLYIDNNCKSMDSCSNLVTEILALSSLQSLMLDGYPGVIFNQSFGNLSKLTYVDFGGNDGKCNINYITNETFTGLADTPLETLTMNDCNIKQVQPGSLSTLVHLRHLSLSSNRDLCHDGWRNITTGLHLTSIETLVLETNCVNLHPDTHVVSESDLNPLFTTKLLSLDLHHCNLQVIEPGLIARGLPQTLQRLVLYNNNLNSVIFLFFLPWLSNLEYLDVSTQNRYNYASILSNISKANDSKLWTHVKALDCIPRIPIGLLPLPPRLKFLNVSNLNLNWAVPLISFQPNNSLEVVDAALCLLPWICGKIGGLHHLKFLNFSSNRIRFIGYDAFSDMPLLEDLNLSDNPMGDTFDDDHSVVLFQNLTRLTTLDLSSAGIKRLPVFIFSHLNSLRVLKLRNNALETIQFKIDGFLQTLRLLDVSYNSIKNLPNFLTADLDRLANPSLFVLLLSNNKLRCDCEQLPFAKWITQTTINIADRRNITCKAQNTTAIKLRDFKLIQGQMALDCVDWIVLTTCVSYFLCSITILGLVTALYRQRWKLRYLYYSSLKRVNPYMLIDDQYTEDTNDAYLSFDEDHILEDGSRLYDVISVKVVNALDEQGIRAKIREDLCVGKSLNSEISAVIQQSRNTIVFLSRDYCKDFWNVFEFNMAAYDGMYTNRKVIVPVLVGEVGSTDLLPEVRAYLHKEVVTTFRVEKFTEFMDQICHAISK